MNVYDTFWRSRTSDNERHWWRFELRECFLFIIIIIIIIIVFVVNNDDDDDDDR